MNNITAEFSNENRAAASESWPSEKLGAFVQRTGCTVSAVRLTKKNKYPSVIFETDAGIMTCIFIKAQSEAGLIKSGDTPSKSWRLVKTPSGLLKISVTGNTSFTLDQLAD